MTQIIKTPDLGVEKAEVIELLVGAGEQISEGQGLVLVESDKASMEIPAPAAGVLKDLLVKVGDSISEGVELAEMETADAQATASAEQDRAPEQQTPETQVETTQAHQTAVTEQSGEPQTREVFAPDLGVDSAKVIEILVAVGELIEPEQGLVMLESDKASMELPSPFAGMLVELKVAQGDDIEQGTLVALIATADTDKAAPAPQSTTTEPATGTQTQTSQAQPQSKPQPQQLQTDIQPTPGKAVYAGPGVRKLARELGVDLGQIKGSGPKSRILKEDLHQHVKQKMQAPASAGTLSMGSQALTAAIDFSQFGQTEQQPMTRLHQLTADAMAQSWLSVPRVTQFDQADITDLEAFRKETNNQPQNKEQGVRLTLLAFLVCASVRALKKFPQFNVAVDGHQIVQKSYYNIGVAVDTPAGLMVPVIHQADTKGITEIAAEIRQLAIKARDKTLKPAEMQGGCFSISSLGGIGGTGFTPMVNYPEVSIMGVANSSMQPVWNGKEFIPRLICPLSLSYDHRAVNGADAARFLSYIAQSASDIRTLLL